MFNLKKILALKVEIKESKEYILELEDERAVNENNIERLTFDIIELNHKLKDVVPVSEIEKVLEYLNNKVRPLQNERKMNPSNLKTKEVLFAHLNIRKALNALVKNEST